MRNFNRWAVEKQSEQDIEKFFMKLKEFGPISESYENFCPKIIVCGGLNKLKLGGNWPKMEFTH